MKKRFKKAVAGILTVAFTITSFSPAFANELNRMETAGELEQYGIVEYDPSEEVLLHITDNDGNEYVVTAIDDANGESVLYNYINGELTEIVLMQPELVGYKYAIVDNNDRNSILTWNVVDTSSLAASNIEQSMNMSRAVTRDIYLGFMHYKDLTITNPRSIECYATDVQIPDRSIPMSGSWTSFASVVAFVSSNLLMEQDKASFFVEKLIASACLSIVSGVIVAKTKFNVSCTQHEQNIYGNSTTDNKPRGVLSGTITLLTEDLKNGKWDPGTEGYTTHDWGTAKLGRAMFKEVYGEAYTPTSWSSTP